MMKNIRYIAGAALLVGPGLVAPRANFRGPPPPATASAPASEPSRTGADHLRRPRQRSGQFAPLGRRAFCRGC